MTTNWAFSPVGETQNVTVSGSAQRVTLNTNASATTLRLMAVGSAAGSGQSVGVIAVKFGDSTVSAVATDTPLMVNGGPYFFDRGNNTHLSVIQISSVTPTLYVTAGIGGK